MSSILSIAPMLDCTDRHFRYFLRLISRHVLLYTEMVSTGAILYGDQSRLLQFHPIENPLALQLGGNDPKALAQCAMIAESCGFNEVNLNVGCPSSRVQKGRFGACLMAEPSLVAHCVFEMVNAVSIPVTVKTRIGIDEHDSYAALTHFIKTVSAAGCNTFIVHARKAWLKGLSPKQNREIPPLRYDIVKRLKLDYPTIKIVLNGGITSLNQAQLHLNDVDGVMLGRAAYHNPYLLADVDRRFYNDQHPTLSRIEIVEAYMPYIEEQLGSGIYLHQIVRHILGLFHAMPGARQWRRYITEYGRAAGANSDVLVAAAEHVKAMLNKHRIYQGLDVTPPTL